MSIEVTRSIYAGTSTNNNNSNTNNGRSTNSYNSYNNNNNNNNNTSFNTTSINNINNITRSNMSRCIITNMTRGRISGEDSRHKGHLCHATRPSM